MPPCSAIERSRLMTRHTVRYGANHSSQYTHGWPTAIDDRDEHELHRDDATRLLTDRRRRRRARRAASP